MHRSRKDKKDLPEGTMYRLSAHESADETKHGPISTTDLFLKNLLVFGSVVLVISVILYLIL
jgi:hypothetical protein